MSSISDMATFNIGVSLTSNKIKDIFTVKQECQFYFFNVGDHVNGDGSNFNLSLIYISVQFRDEQPITLNVLL